VFTLEAPGVRDQDSLGPDSDVFAIVLATVWGTTQWTSWRLAYQPELGAPWFWLFGSRIYVPLSFCWWWFSFDAYAPRIFVKGAYIAASGGFAVVAVAIGMSVWRAREAKTAETYGSARWPTRARCKAPVCSDPMARCWAGISAPTCAIGVPEHVLCFAPNQIGQRR
jgi:type IV secretion system protein VirD4